MKRRSFFETVRLQLITLMVSPNRSTEMSLPNANHYTHDYQALNLCSTESEVKGPGDIAEFEIQDFFAKGVDG